MQYKSTVATNAIPLFTAAATGGWQYWTTLTALPAAPGWTQFSAPLAFKQFEQRRVVRGLIKQAHEQAVPFATQP